MTSSISQREQRLLKKRLGNRSNNKKINVPLVYVSQSIYKPKPYYTLTDKRNTTNGDDDFFDYEDNHNEITEINEIKVSYKEESKKTTMKPLPIDISSRPSIKTDNDLPLIHMTSCTLTPDEKVSMRDAFLMALDSAYRTWIADKNRKYITPARKKGYIEDAFNKTGNVVGSVAGVLNPLNAISNIGSGLAKTFEVVKKAYYYGGSNPDEVIREDIVLEEFTDWFKEMKKIYNPSIHSNFTQVGPPPLDIIQQIDWKNEQIVSFIYHLTTRKDMKYDKFIPLPKIVIAKLEVANLITTTIQEISDKEYMNSIIPNVVKQAAIETKIRELEDKLEIARKEYNEMDENGESREVAREEKKKDILTMVKDLKKTSFPLGLPSTAWFSGKIGKTMNYDEMYPHEFDEEEEEEEKSSTELVKGNTIQIDNDIKHLIKSLKTKYIDQYSEPKQLLRKYRAKGKLYKFVIEHARRKGVFHQDKAQKIQINNINPIQSGIKDPQSRNSLVDYFKQSRASPEQLEKLNKYNVKLVDHKRKALLYYKLSTKCLDLLHRYSSSRMPLKAQQILNKHIEWQVQGVFMKQLIETLYISRNQNMQTKATFKDFTEYILNKCE